MKNLHFQNHTFGFWVENEGYKMSYRLIIQHYYVNLSISQNSLSSSKSYSTVVKRVKNLGINQEDYAMALRDAHKLSDDEIRKEYKRLFQE